MNKNERMVLGLQVWWLTFGMGYVDTMKLMEIDAILGGFVWKNAMEDGILTERTAKGLALTQKALDLIKEYQHGH